MTKKQLKEIIENLHLDKKLADLIYELIDGAQSVNKELLNVVADVLETDAQFLQNSAALLDEEADEYESLAQELQAIDAEEQKDIVDAIVKNNEEVMADVKTKIDEMNARGNQTSSPSPVSTDQAQDSTSKLQEITENLAQASQG